MIRGIIFDCFGVLYGRAVDAIRELCPDKYQQGLSDLNKQADHGFISGREYIEGIAEIVGRTTGEIREILDERHVRNSELLAYSQSLRDHYKVGLLSNVSSGTLDEIFSPEERSKLFDAVLLSYEEHLVKPNPEVFRIMAQRMGLRPEECVMIDDLEENCEGAEVAGMRSVQHITNAYTKEMMLKILQETK